MTELTLPEKITSFNLNGSAYTQTWRKCNKANCKCQSDWSHRHGPYWQKKGPHKNTYIGKTLPQSVIKAYFDIKESKTQINHNIAELENEILELQKELDIKLSKRSVLLRLKNGDHIFRQEHPILSEYGFLELLPQEPDKTVKPKKNRLAA